MSHAFFKTILLHLYCKCANHFLPGRVPGRKYISGCKCGRGCKITACEKRRIPGKGSSVDIFSVFSLWNPFSNEKGHIDHIPGKVWISWG